MKKFNNSAAFKILFLVSTCDDRLPRARTHFIQMALRMSCDVVWTKLSNKLLDIKLFRLPRRRTRED